MVCVINCGLKPAAWGANFDFQTRSLILVGVKLFRQREGVLSDGGCYGSDCN